MTKEQMEKDIINLLIDYCIERNFINSNLTNDFFRDFERKAWHGDKLNLWINKDLDTGYVDIAMNSHDNHIPDLNIYISELDIQLMSKDKIRAEKLDSIL